MDLDVLRLRSVMVQYLHLPRFLVRKVQHLLSSTPSLACMMDAEATVHCEPIKVTRLLITRLRGLACAAFRVTRHYAPSRSRRTREGDGEGGSTRVRRLCCRDKRRTGSSPAPNAGQDLVKCKIPVEPLKTPRESPVTSTRTRYNKSKQDKATLGNTKQEP
ncbi:hypothetical protein E2C01_002386 [Portunus trituberculatus]|uniref:Uncharacterized protein n=1 Tax=Portunus trituberculatus TaxID=210409 RepID=A0A5B7CJT1_PORTR|nr:hypothetical protein [Portunus trituberculatus]